MTFAEFADFAEHFARSPYEERASWGFGKQPSELCELCAQAHTNDAAAYKVMSAWP